MPPVKPMLARSVKWEDFGKLLNGEQMLIEPKWDSTRRRPRRRRASPPKSRRPPARDRPRRGSRTQGEHDATIRGDVGPNRSPRPPPALRVSPGLRPRIARHPPPPAHARADPLPLKAAPSRFRRRRTRTESPLAGPPRPRGAGDEDPAATAATQRLDRPRERPRQRPNHARGRSRGRVSQRAARADPPNRIGHAGTRAH